MYRGIKEQIWFFNCEWVPDVRAGRIYYGLPESVTDDEVVREMFRQAGATADNPYPHMKTNLCKIISVSALMRRQLPRNGRNSHEDVLKFNLLWLPRDTNDSANLTESSIVGTFLNAVGKFKPQLIAYDLIDRHLKMLFQRAIINEISAVDFCDRPNKPWEGVDYFSKESGYTIDLKLLYSFGSRNDEGPLLNELAGAANIPMVPNLSRGEIIKMYSEGRTGEIIAQSAYSALTTYLLWLRTSHFAGYITDEDYETEQMIFHDAMLDESEKPGMEFLTNYLDAWN